MRINLPRLSGGQGLFFVALPVCAVVAALGVIAPELLAAWSTGVIDVAFRALDWFYLATVGGFLILSLWLGYGPYGHIRLGRDNETPEFSLVSWLAMLFAAGMGIGLLFWGVAEPVKHFADPPASQGGNADAAGRALSLTVFSWGLHAWGIYCFSGLALAYYGFRRKAPHLSGTPIRWAFSGRWVEPLARAADLISVLAVVFGVAGATGTGIMQLHAGLHLVAGIPAPSNTIAIAILGILAICFMTSAATSLDKGIKWLSNLNIALAAALMLYVLLAGPTPFLVRHFVSGLGDYLSSLPAMSLQLYPFAEASGWLDWTLTNLVWWIAWAPFVGVFIARISRGRTIREFVTGVLLAPTVFSLLWFAVFGGTALHEELFGAGGMARLVEEDVTAALFALLDRLPGSALLGVVAIVLLFIFLVTSLDSATFVLGMLTTGGAANPPVMRKLAWGLVLGGFAAALLLSGEIQAVRAIAITGAIPFTLVLLLQGVALIRSLRAEREERDALGTH